MAGALDVIRVIADMTLLGQSILNVYHMVSASSVPDDEVIQDAQVGLDDLYQLVNAEIDNQLSYNSIRVFNVTDNQDLGIHDWPTLVAGAADAQCLPLGVAALLTLPTSVPKVRGRKFFCGFSEGAQADGVWGSGVVDSLNDIGAFMLTPMLGDASGEFWRFGVPTSIGGFQLFASSLVGNIPAYQRRRKQGVGA